MALSFKSPRPASTSTDLDPAPSVIPDDVPVVDAPARLSVRERLRFLAKDSLLYGGASAFSRAFSLITFPLLARHFSVGEYGVVDIFSTITTFLVNAFVFGQDSAVARFFYESEEPEYRRQVVSQSLALELVLLCVGIPILWMFAAPIATRISSAGEADVVLELVLAQVPMLVLINFSQNILKWTFDRKRFLIMSVGTTVSSILALLVAILVLDLQVRDVFTVYLIVRSVFALVGIVFVRKWLRWPRDRRLVRDMLPFAVPYGVIAIVSAFVPTAERTLTSNLLGSHDLGLLAAGTRVAMLIALPIQAFHVAWGPFSFSIFRERDAAQTYNWVLKAFAVGMVLATLALTAVSEPAIRILASNRYAGASIVVFALALGSGLEATGWIANIGIGLSKRSHLYYYAYGVFVCVSVGAMLALIRVLGFSGVAWGALIGYAAKTGMEAWCGQRAYPLPWQYGGVVRVVMITIAIGIACQATSTYMGPLAGSVMAAGALPVVALFAWLNVFNDRERGRIRDAARSVFAAAMSRAS